MVTSTPLVVTVAVCSTSHTLVHAPPVVMTAVWMKGHHGEVFCRRVSVSALRHQHTSLTFSCFSFFLRTSSHSLTIRPHRIQVSSSRWDRLEEAEELDTREEPLFLREPFMERRDLLSVSRSLELKIWRCMLSIRAETKHYLLLLSILLQGLTNTIRWNP